MSHGDHVSTLPDEFNLIAATASAPIAAMEHAEKPIYAKLLIFRQCCR